ncbi:MAG: tetratricopeptide repeat protein [Kordia sp.]|uniref:tetratricopeptide repeat protein n=1 Tax=Kordia sp. TaxID=1965332 RepID=UPI00385C4095
MPLHVALIFMLSLLTFRLLTTVIHELGHAIPALLLTKGKVTVYMGSHGNPEKSMQFQLGRLECFFKFNLFYWKGGLCVMHEKDVSVRTSFIVTIFGPLLSLIVAGIGVLILLLNEFGDVTKLVIFALIFSCIVDFLNNIFPNRDTITLHDGTFTNNDGMQLLTLWKFRKSYRKFQLGNHYLENSEFEDAAAIFEEGLKFKNNEDIFYRLAIYANLMQQDFEKAKLLQDAFTKNHKELFETSDYINLSVIQSYFEMYHEAIISTSKVLKEDPNNTDMLNNRGYALGMLDKHTEAIVDLDKAIILEPDFAFAWNNRGFSKLKLGQLQEAYKDINYSLQLDVKNAHAYRNLGLYYFYKKDYQKALNLYQKANEINPNTLLLQEYITESTFKLSD